jgi:glucokinase
MSLILALDFGGTKLSAAVLERGQKRWRALERAPSRPHATAEDDLSLCSHLAAEVLAGARPAAVGVSFGGPVEAVRGVVRLSDHVLGWEDYPLKDHLGDHFGAGVSVDNDANTAALGEFTYGAGRGCDSLLYVTVSTGVGGGWVLGGRVWRGHDGMAGEIGHTLADANGPRCYCGKRGCVERLASGPYLAAHARELLGTQPEAGEKLRALVGGDVEAVTAKHVAETAARGDALAREVLERAAWALGVGLGNAANLMNPERVVLGGGVTKSGERYWRVVREVARATARSQIRLEIVPAALEDDAPLWGAVALAEGLLAPSPAS